MGLFNDDEVHVDENVSYAKEVPKIFFQHVCKSETNGIEVGSVKIENVLQMKSAPLYTLFKRDMLIEIQDKECPYHLWISKVLKNVGGRLLLQIQKGNTNGIQSIKKEPFWLFFLNERIFPLGWAKENGLPWKVMNFDAYLENSISSSILNELKCKIPEQHCYNVGEMLEVINPYSLMVFHVATIIKIYDHYYFKVEVDNEIDVEKRISFVATKENPYLFNAGWANKHKFPLKPPSDWKSPNEFSWSRYMLMKNSKLASVDIKCRKNVKHIHIGMKLEAVDSLNTDSIRMATVEGFADHWMFLSFDDMSWNQKILHVRSVYSDEVFPVGWCKKHKYSLSVSKFPYRDNLSFDDGLAKSLKNINNEDSEKEKSTTSKTVNKKVDGKSIFIIKKETPKLDNRLNGALCLDVKVDNIQENINSVQEKMNTAKKVKPKKYTEVNNIDSIIESVVKNTTSENSNKTYICSNKDFYSGCPVVKKKRVSIDLKPEYAVNNTTSENSNKICIYFNKDCKSGLYAVKEKILTLPNSIGPGCIPFIFQKAITIFVSLQNSPMSALEKIKNKKIFNERDGVKVLICAKETRSHLSSCMSFLIPESKKLAGTYCSALCDIFGMCKFFMTTENIKCPHVCNVKKDKTEIISSKNNLRRIDNISNNTNSEVETIEQEELTLPKNWKKIYEDYYRKNPRFKDYIINIGLLKSIEITSDPRCWSPQDLYTYLENDISCKYVASILRAEGVDGKEFMLLKDEDIFMLLQCSINLAIRVMCHLSELRYVCEMRYGDIEDS